uniref:Multidrug resistance protein 1 n=1 Tax=Steinernema glaseri TaxID=37863 RepID=A0A1I8A8Z0_9BILA
MGLFKKKEADTEKHDADKEKPEEEQKKVSILQLFRYASKFDLILITIGSLVAIGTGLGFPFMAVIFGDISQSFINATMNYDNANITVGNETIPFRDIYSLDTFGSDVARNCLYYVYLGIAMFVAATVQVMCFLVAGENMIHRMRIAFLKAVLRQDIPWYDKNHSGTLTTKLFDNLERVKEGTGDKCALLIQFVSQFFSGLIIAFSYDWRLTLIMISLSPFMMLCGAFIAKLMASSATREAENYAKAGSVAEEVLTSIRTVVSFNGQEIECNRYNKALKASRRDGIIKSIYVGIGLAATFLIIFSSYTLAFWVGTDYVVWGWIEPGTLLTVFFSVMMGSMAMGQAGPQFAVMGTAQGAAAAIYEIIDREPEIDSYSEEGVRPSRIDGRIVVNDVRFHYPTRPDIPILKGISFDVNPGQTVALVGSSGCGKSTIVQLLLRYYNPLSGSITIDGHEISDINIRHLRNLIGVVSQEPILFNCSIKKNIMYGNEDISDEDIVRACRKANAENFINDLPEKYETLVGDRGTQLSGGQKQRIAIARALVRDPKILLLDEATSALDAESESIVQEALEKASKGRTTLIIAHRLSTIRNADKIVAIKGGEVHEVGRHEELMQKRGLYYELVNAQVFADIEKQTDPEKQLLERQLSNISSVRSRFSSVSSMKNGGTGIGRLMSVEEDDEDVPPPLKPGQQPDVKSETKRLQKDLEKEGAKPANLLAILKYARSEWIYIIIAVIASIIQGCVFPAFSLFFTEVISVFATPDKDEKSRKGHFWALMFLVLGVVQGVTMFSQAFLFGMSAERLTMRLRSMLFRNIMRMDIAYFDQPNHSSGKIATRLASDTPNVKSAIDYRLGSVFTAIVSVGCGIGIAFYYGWQMALLVVAIFPLGGVGQALQMKYIEGRSKADAKELENSGKTAMEAIENIRTVQALTLEDRFHRAFADHLAYPHSTSTRKSIVQGFTYGFSNSIFYFLYASAFRFGLYLIVHHILAPMHVMKVLFAISFTAGSLGFASAYFPEYIKARFAAGIIFKMLGETPKIDGLSHKGKRPDVRGHVHFNDLHFVYPERPGVQILKGLSLTVEPGQTLALVGPSGCGKSTVISLLERFYDPLDGQVVVDSTNLCEINPGHIRSQMALVSQEPILFDCSIRENIVYGLDPESITDAQIDEVSRLANIHKFISELPDGLDTRVGEKGTQLSGGQKQRIAIARALIRKPKILLLDEATSALDTESEKVVQEALDRAREGRTCIVIAHRLATVVNADCIAVVTDGVVIEKGTHSELMNLQGAYYKLTQKQNMKKE